MRELASQAASDTIGNRERTFLDKEFQQLRSEVGRIVESTEFNGSRVLSPEDNKPIKIFVGSKPSKRRKWRYPNQDEENNPRRHHHLGILILAPIIRRHYGTSNCCSSRMIWKPETAEDLGPEGTVCL